ncbi:hypothetical protein RF11_06351 [Thelohanellus kitauei]|uniref:Uncharacterized protein n=1 Tax=Thelohanellus kitauei TaxID=669202 RepID=A0A0C2J1L2_THEKT|nr:hypothetical protein RF11_06351 [Thelohanellus kitauei]
MTYCDETEYDDLSPESTIQNDNEKPDLEYWKTSNEIKKGKTEELSHIKSSEFRFAIFRPIVRCNFTNDDIEEIVMILNRFVQAVKFDEQLFVPVDFDPDRSSSSSKSYEAHDIKQYRCLFQGCRQITTRKIYMKIICFSLFIGLPAAAFGPNNDDEAVKIQKDNLKNIGCPSFQSKYLY